MGFAELDLRPFLIRCEGSHMAATTSNNISLSILTAIIYSVNVRLFICFV